MKVFEGPLRPSRSASRNPPGIPRWARWLHHCRDPETEQPLDFFTGFEFAAAYSADFDHLSKRSDTRRSSAMSTFESAAAQIRCDCFSQNCKTLER